MESAGESTDGMCDSVSTLRDKIKALTGGVDIMSDEAGTQFKSTYQIMKDISEVWDNMTDINQAALLETIAGKMRGNSISALLKNMSQAEKVLETSMNSAGSAMEEHDRWLDSIAAKEATMKAAWQDFSDSFISTSAIKGWYEGLTGILNVATQIVDQFGTIPTVLGLITSVLGLGGKGLAGVATNSNGQLIGRIGLATTDDFKNYGFKAGLTSILNGSIDTGILNQYSDALKNGATSAGALNAALINADGSIKQVNVSTALQLKNLGASNDELSALGVSTSKITAKTLALSAAQTALNSVISIGTGLLVSWAASAVMNMITDAINGVTEQSKQIDQLTDKISGLKDDYSSIDNEFTNVNSELETTQQRIDELLKKNKLTFVEQQELEQLQQTNHSLEERAKNLERLREIKQQDIRDTVAAKWKTDMEDSKEYLSDEEVTIVYTPTLVTKEKKRISELDEMRRQAEEYSDLAKQGYSDYEKYRNAEELAREELNKASDEQKEAKQKAYEAAKADLENANKYQQYERFLREEYEKISGYIDEYGNVDDSVTKEWREHLDYLSEILDPSKYRQQKLNDLLGLNEYKDTIKEIQDLADSGKLDADAILSYEQFSNALKSVGISAEEAAEHFNALVKKQQEAQQEVLSSTALYEQFGLTTNALKTASEIFSEQGYSGTITNAQYVSLLELGEEYAECIDNNNGYLSLNIEKVQELTQAQYEQQKASAALSKEQAKLKYKENAQEIAILQEALEMAAKAGANAEVLSNLQMKIGGLQFDNSGLLSEISSLELLTSQLNYATSAYKKWLDARNMPEAKDTYESLRTALSDIQEGLDSGWTGTLKYKAAVDLMVPDGQDVSNYIKKIERYLTEDTSGLNNFINDMYKEAFLSKDSNGTFSFLEGVTVESIAKGLGLTTEFTQYALTALKDMGWDVSIFDKQLSDADLLKNYEAAVDNAAKAQERLAEAQKAYEATKNTGDIKEQAEALKEVAEATKEVASAQEQVKEAASAAGVEEELTGIEKLKAEFTELQELYGQLNELKLEVDPNFAAYAESIGSIVEALNQVPENGYNLNIDSEGKLAAAQQTVGELQKGLESVKTFASEGLISEADASTLTSTFETAISEIQGKIDEFKANNSSETTEPIQLTVEADTDEAQGKIESAAEGPYEATIVVKADTEEAVRAAMEAKEKLNNPDFWNLPEPEEQTNPQAPSPGPSPSPQTTPRPPEDYVSNNQEMGQATDSLGKELKDATAATQSYSNAVEQTAGTTQAATAATQEYKETITPSPASTPAPSSTSAPSSSVVVQQVVYEADTSKAEKEISNIEPEPVELAVEADTTSLESAISLLDQLQASMQNNPFGGLEAAMADVGVSIDEVMEAINTVQEACGQPIILTADASEAIAEAESFIGAWDGKQIMMFIQGNASGAISAASAAVSQINSMTATLHVTATVDKSAVPTKFAKGTHYAKEEDAIVGEEGIETWIHGGKYYTVGHNGPELVHLSRGDQVLTNEETKKLFGGKKRLSGNAYASGLGSIIGTIAAGIGTAVAVVSAVKNNFSSVVSGTGTQSTQGNGKTVTGSGTTSTPKPTSSSNGNSNNNNSGGGGGGGGGSSNNTSKTDSSSSSSDKDTSDYVDWIETALENQKRITDEFIKFSERAVGYSDKNSELQKAMGNINEEISLNQRANERYLQQADRIAKEENLSASIVEKIKNGTIDINKYDDDTRKAISSYQKWYDLAQDCLDTITDLKDQQYELATQKLDNIIQHYENRINLLGVVFDSYQNQIDKKIANGKEVVRGDYAEMISNTEQQISLLEEERDALTKELNTLVRAGTIKVGSDDWYEYISKINEFSNSIDAAELSLGEFQDNINDISMNNLKIAMDTIEYAQETIQGLLDLRSAQGKTATAGDYRDLISASSKQIKNLQTQNAELRKQQIGLDILSEKYQEIQGQINENEKAILSAKTKQEEWNDAIIDLQIQKLQKQNKEYQSQLDLMDAIEELEKEKQRRALVYHEGVGFTYETPNDNGIQSAQRNLDNLLLERHIEQLEAAKADSNLYDDFGNELIPITDTLSGLDLSAYYNSVLGSRENSSLLASALENFNIGSMIANGAAAKDLSVVIESGAIQLSGVQDVNELAEAITYQLPNALLQQLYK